MKSSIPGTLAPVILASLCAGSADAATQTVLGKRFQVKNPVASDSSRRKVNGQAREGGSTNAIVGDPTASGATLRVITNGATDSDQTFNLPREGWRAIGSIGFQYTNSIPGGAVEKASIKKTPSGVFQIKILILGKGYPVVVVPPNPGDDGGYILNLIGGDSYCVAFGGAAGGAEIHDDGTQWLVKSPTAEGCPVNPTTTSTSTTSTSSTSSTSPFPTTSTSSTSSSTSSTIEGTTTSSTTPVSTTTTTLPPFPFNDCGGSPFPTCGGTGCPAGTECAIVFGNPVDSTDGGCACVPVGPGEQACGSVPPDACPANPVCPPGTACFANPSFGGGCGCAQCNPCP